MDLLQGGSQSSANMASRGRGNGGHGPGHGNGNNRGRGNGRGRSNGGRQGGNGERVTCQLCGKDGHTVLKCYKRFDVSFTGISEKTSVEATSSYVIDTN
jgi:hypothetical protein